MTPSRISIRKNAGFLSIILCFIVFFVSGCTQAKHQPLAEQGILDLSDWNFKNDGNVTLKGEWEFYWHRLLEPADFLGISAPKNEGYIDLPAIWNGYRLNDQSLPGIGYATYRLVIIANTQSLKKAIRLKDASSALRLWVNGKELAEYGTVGVSGTDMIPEYRADIFSFEDSSSQLEIILQVSNFNHRKGGAWEPIVLGDESTIKRQHNLLWAFDLFLFGALTVMALHYFHLFLLRKKENYYAFFSLLSLTSVIRVLVVGDRLLQAYIPDLSWELAYKIELWTIILASPLIVSFFCSLYPEICKKPILRLIQAIGVVFFLMPFFMSAILSSYLVIPIQVYFLLTIPYSLYLLIKALILKKAGAGYLLTGFGFFIITAINDILTTNDIIYSIYLGSFGIFLLMLLLSFTLSFRFSRAFDAEESLTNMLVEKSKELETKNIELFEADKFKDEILANTSHELRTPINGIVGISESLLQGISGELSESVHRNISLIASSGRRLSHLINDLLDLSRIKERDLALDNKAINIQILTEIVVAHSKPLLKGKAIVLENQIPSSLPSVLGDENRILQILYNLVGNAVKFTEAGYIRISAKQNNKAIQITVSDTGIGIPEDEFQRIFESFEQVDSAPTRSYAGTGLGLSITRQLVELHGGSIWVDSRQGKGSDFHFTLPVCLDSLKPEDSTLTVLQDSKAISRSVATPENLNSILQLPVKTTPSSPWIVAVDDDVVNLEVVVNFFALHQMTNITTCLNGQEALDLINQKGKPDLVLLDIMMPRMSGFELCRKLRIHYTPSELPIIMLTAKNTLADLVEGFKAGACDYLTKPITKEELISRTAIHLKLAHAYRILRENLSLRKQLAQRQETEQTLKLTHGRLTAMLDHIDMAIVAINEQSEICFFNRQFSDLSGYSAGAMLGKSMLELFAEESKPIAESILQKWQTDGSMEESERYPHLLFKRANQSRYERDLMITVLEVEQEQLALLILRNSETLTDMENQHLLKGVEKVVNTINRNRRHIQTLEAVFNQANTVAPAEQAVVAENLKSVDRALEQVEKSLSDKSVTTKQRQLIVDIMNLCLSYWLECTDSTKVELARKSGIWKVYTDNTGWDRTQTLDKYLDYTLVPQKPRISQVIETAEFVLLTCEKPSALRVELEDKSKALRFSA